MVKLTGQVGSTLGCISWEVVCTIFCIMYISEHLLSYGVWFGGFVLFCFFDNRSITPIVVEVESLHNLTLEYILATLLKVIADFREVREET